MPKRREVGVTHERNRHGNMRWVYREPRRPGERIWGKRTILPGEYGSAEFKAALNRARGFAGPLAAAPVVKAHNQTHTLAWLIDRYMSSTAFPKVKNTARSHRGSLSHVLAKAGHLPYRDITSIDIKATRDHIRDNGSDKQNPQPAPAMANRVISCLSVMFDWAIEENLLEVNPCAGVKKVK